MKDIEKFLFYDLLTEEEKKSLKINIYSKNEIITEFADLDKFYFILEGKLKLANFLEDSTLWSGSTLTTNYLVGIIRFLNGNKGEEVAIALDDKFKVIEIPYKIIARLKEESLEFNKYLIDLILNRSLEEYGILHIRTYFGLKGLIAKYLVRRSKNNFVYIDNFNDVIKALNISNNGFYRALNYLVEEGLIDKSENSIKILDEEKLKELYSVKPV